MPKSSFFSIKKFTVRTIFMSVNYPLCGHRSYHKTQFVFLCCIESLNLKASRVRSVRLQTPSQGLFPGLGRGGQVAMIKKRCSTKPRVNSFKRTSLRLVFLSARFSCYCPSLCAAMTNQYAFL